MPRSRYLVIAGAIVAVLTASIIVLRVAERSEIATPAASSTVSQTAIASPSPTGTPCVGPCGGATGPASSSGPTTAVYNDDFGFAIAEVGQATSIRAESSDRRLGTLDSQSPAVSPDGRQIAYWSSISSAPQQLRLVSAADTSKARVLSALGTDERGGQIAWANDGSGLVYSVQVPKGGPPTSSVIRSFDLRGGAVPAERTWLALTSTPGKLYAPITWDRTRFNLIVAGLTGDGAFMEQYVTIHTDTPGSQRSDPVPVRIPMSSVKVSSDASFAIGLDLDAKGFTYWPLQSMNGAGHHPPESKYGVTGAVWRPGTHEIGFIGPSNQFELCDVDKDLGQQVPTCSRTVFSGVPEGASVRAFRADGTAVLFSVIPPAAGGLGQDFTLVTLGDGQRASFSDQGGLFASVRLR